MKTFVAAVAALAVSGAAFAQVGTAVQKAGDATAEKAKQAKEETQASGSGQPEKTIHKLKGKYHKSKASSDADDAKAAAKAAVK